MIGVAGRSEPHPFLEFSAVHSTLISPLVGRVPRGRVRVARLTSPRGRRPGTSPAGRNDRGAASTRGRCPRAHRPRRHSTRRPRSPRRRNTGCSVRPREHRPIRSLLHCTKDPADTGPGMDRRGRPRGGGRGRNVRPRYPWDRRRRRGPGRGASRSSRRDPRPDRASARRSARRHHTPGRNGNPGRTDTARRSTTAPCRLTLRSSHGGSLAVEGSLGARAKATRTTSCRSAPGQPGLGAILPFCLGFRSPGGAPAIAFGHGR